MNKKRVKSNFRNKLLLFIFLVWVSAFFLIEIIDKRLTTILKQYINIEVERVTNNIVNKSINELMATNEYGKFLIIERDTNDIEKISYNTLEINRLTNDVSKYIQKELLELDDGYIDDFFVSDRMRKSRFNKIKKGIICDVSLGSIRNSSMFANVGPMIPIKLVFMSQVKTDVDVKIKEYGINNVMVEIYLIVKVREVISMPITSDSREIIVKEPISIDIVRGSIPNYYGGIIN
ncbi:MAG: sporulation protein YunB [Bacilli bacterium]|nr:sporulation protein YunB [Bacilli bacterium]